MKKDPSGGFFSGLWYLQSHPSPAFIRNSMLSYQFNNLKGLFMTYLERQKKCVHHVVPYGTVKGLNGL